MPVQRPAPPNTCKEHHSKSRRPPALRATRLANRSKGHAKQEGANSRCTGGACLTPLSHENKDSNWFLSCGTYLAEGHRLCLGYWLNTLATSHCQARCASCSPCHSSDCCLPFPTQTSLCAEWRSGTGKARCHRRQPVRWKKLSACSLRPTAASSEHKCSRLLVYKLSSTRKQRVNMAQHLAGLAGNDQLRGTGSDGDIWRGSVLYG